MIGAIIGDIVGSRFEFNNTSSKDFELSYPLCDYTDDTICTIAIADAILSIKGNVASSEIIEQITIRSYGKDYKDRLPARGVFDETCMGCVPLALYITNHSHNFEYALRNAISYGGDSDTIGAIVGSIAEARWGVPHWIEHEFMQYLPTEMINVVNQFKQKYK